MTYYAGLDVSLKEVSICVVDDDGEVWRRVARQLILKGWQVGSGTDLWPQSGSCMKAVSFRSGCSVEWCN